MSSKRARNIASTTSFVFLQKLQPVYFCLFVELKQKWYFNFHTYVVINCILHNWK